MQNRNRVCRTGRGRTKLGLERGVEPSDQSTAFGGGSPTRRPVALALTHALRDDGTTLRNELRVQIGVMLEVAQMYPQSTSEERRTARGGTVELSLESGTDPSATDASFFPAELDELAPSLRAGTLEDGRGDAQGMGDFEGGQASRDRHGSFESLVAAADQIRVFGDDPSVEQLGQTNVEIRAVLCQVRAGHGSPTRGLEATDSTPRSDRHLERSMCTFASIGLQGPASPGGSTTSRPRPPSAVRSSPGTTPSIDMPGSRCSPLMTSTTVEPTESWRNVNRPFASPGASTRSDSSTGRQSHSLSPKRSGSTRRP